MIELVQGVQRPGQTPVFTYQSDINRAEEQTRVTVAGLIDAKVTTVVCMCDAIAPVFLTNGMTQNNYFPEHLLPGANLLDYDVLGRLYDPAQWAHAFGPSQLAEPGAVRAERRRARSGGPPGTRASRAPSCNLITGYLTLIGSMLQKAGPEPQPAHRRAGPGRHAATAAAAGPRPKGNPGVYLIKFGPERLQRHLRLPRGLLGRRRHVDDRRQERAPTSPMNGGSPLRARPASSTATFTVPAKPQ